MLGVGRTGNRIAKPQWSAQELSKELLDVLQGQSSLAIQLKANEVARLCERNGMGAMVAAQTLLSE